MDFENLPKELIYTSPWSGNKECLTVEYAHYQDGSVAIQLFVAEGEDAGMPYCNATVCVPGKLWPGEIAIKDYSENEGMLDALVEAGIVEEAHRYVMSGYAVIPVCYLKGQAPEDEDE